MCKRVGISLWWTPVIILLLVIVLGNLERLLRGSRTADLPPKPLVSFPRVAKPKTPYELGRDSLIGSAVPGRAEQTVSLTNYILKSQSSGLDTGRDQNSGGWPSLGLPLSVVCTNSSSLTIDNAGNDCSVLVGLRLIERVGWTALRQGNDFEVAARGKSVVPVPKGHYEVYFRYANDPSIYRGDDIDIEYLSHCTIAIAKRSGGNYRIRRL